MSCTTATSCTSCIARPRCAQKRRHCARSEAISSHRPCARPTAGDCVVAALRAMTSGLESRQYRARALVGRGALVRQPRKRGGGVVMKKLPNGTNGCTAADTTSRWSCGWFICEDKDGNGECGTTELVLQRVDAPPRMMIVRTSAGENISFNRWGLIGGTYLGFNVLPLDKTLSDPNARGVCMSSGGRVRTVPQEDVPCTS